MKKVNKVTGLTAAQESAIAMLVSGKNITDTAKELDIDRGTLYAWMKRINFKAYYNKLCDEAQVNVKNGIWGLYDNALKVIADNLNSENVLIKSKTAFWLIEKIEKIEIGHTNPRDWIKKESTVSTLDWELNTKLDKEKYDKLIAENNLGNSN